MADTLRIYHDRDKTFERELKALHEEKISARNKELITSFQNYLFSTGSGQLRVSKLSSQLRRICQKLGKDIDATTKRDLLDFIAYINQKADYSDDTKADYRRTLKQFYRWFQDTDIRLDSDDKKAVKETEKMYTYLEKEVSASCKLKKVDFSSILSDEDINKVIEATNSIKEKAFLKMLHETGCRAGEFLNVKIKDIVLLKNRGMLVVDGKTGERKIPLVNSVPYIVQWLSIHPFRDNKESYIWVGENRRQMYEPLKHKGSQILIDRCFENAGFIKKDYLVLKLENGKEKRKLTHKEQSKPCNFHWFRHSRATLLAPHLTDSLLCKYMGWSIGSRQVRRYVHLCTKQLENAILEINGLKDEEKQETEKPQLCACGNVNTSNARYCYKCGNPLKVSTVIQDQETVKAEIDDRLRVYGEIMQNPEKRAEFEKFKKIFFETDKS